MTRSRPRGRCLQPLASQTLRPLTLCLLALALMAAGTASAQDHDLVLDPAPDVTSTAAADQRSPDLKVGADFGDASVPDVVRRGVVNPIYGRFYVNGVNDFMVPSGAVQLRFHWRDATVGETPPALGAPGANWHLIGSLPVTWAATDPTPFLLLTRVWPTDYPSVTTTSVPWTPPTTGSHYHLRAEAVYPAGTTDDNPGDNVAVSLYDSILGLRDVDVVIVHDVSGSMITYMHAGSTYLAQAKARAQAFVTSMNEDHRLAVVAFGGCLPGGVADVWPTPATPMQNATWGNKLAASAAISANVQAANAGCLTPLGVGVQRALSILTAPPADPTHKKVILLLTDGYENSGTPRACNGADPAGPCLGTALLAQLQAEDVRVFSIALGTAAASDCLECLTGGSDGQWYAPAGPGIDLAQVYLDMQQAYSEDDLYRADRGVTGGGDDTYHTYFEGLDDLLYFILQSDRLDAEIALELRPPGGSWQSAGLVSGARLEQRPGYMVVRVEGAAAGEWEYRVVGQERQSYLVAVRSDRVGVRLGLDVKSEGRVGSPIFIRARLTDRGEPLDARRLVASVTVPDGASLDSLLRQASRRLMARTGTWPVDPRQVKRFADSDPRSIFVAQLTGNGEKPLGKTRVVDVPLRPGRDGSWSGVLEGATEVAGVYEVTVSYRDDKADRRQSKSVRLLPGRLDLAASAAELVKLEDRQRDAAVWRVRVYPVDHFGNAVSDPSLLGRLRVAVRGAEPDGKPFVAFDGALVQALRVPRGGQPELEAVLLRDKKLRLERRVVLSTPEPKR